jgi:hypothetical protein
MLFFFLLLEVVAAKVVEDFMEVDYQEVVVKMVADLVEADH